MRDHYLIGKYNKDRRISENDKNAPGSSAWYSHNIKCGTLLA